MAKRKFVPAIYHDTMSQAIEESKKYAEENGYTISEENNCLIWQSMSYETYQTNLLYLCKNNVKSKKCLNISLYRMHSGRYELTTYIN